MLMLWEAWIWMGNTVDTYALAPDAERRPEQQWGRIPK
jgi:hypothetical protein